MERLYKLMQKFVPLHKEEEQLLESAVQFQTILKGDYFVQEGQVCHYLGFLVSGIMRVYTTIDGKEYTSHFCFERRNPVVCSHMSFLSHRPSLESIQALENTQLIVVSYENLQRLYQQSMHFQELGRLMMEQTYIDAKIRILALQTQSAQIRYQKMLGKYPTIINRIPHHYIASYLGIAPESLSRIRKQLMQS